MVALNVDKLNGVFGYLYCDGHISAESLGDAAVVPGDEQVVALGFRPGEDFQSGGLRQCRRRRFLDRACRHGRAGNAVNLGALRL